jgi:cytoskeletal protein RodZ
MPAITLEQIAQKTKISKSFLTAIENEDWGKLPGGIFDRSYIRQYAEAAGLDAEAILERYWQYHARLERKANPSPEDGNDSGPRSTIRALFSWGT